MITTLTTTNAKIYIQKLELSSLPPREQRAMIHAQQKVLLSLSLGQTDDLPPIARAEHGKPYFPSLPDFHYNFTDSGDYLALATASGDVGIDLQKIVKTRYDIEKLACRYYTGEEASYLSSLSDAAARERTFFRLWAIKEAYLKFLGIGLAGGMNGYTIVPTSKTAGEILPGGSSMDAVKYAVPDSIAAGFLPARYEFLTPPDENYLLAVVTGDNPNPNN